MLSSLYSCKFPVLLHTLDKIGQPWEKLVFFRKNQSGTIFGYQIFAVSNDRLFGRTEKQAALVQRIILVVFLQGTTVVKIPIIAYLFMNATRQIMDF